MFSQCVWCEMISGKALCQNQQIWRGRCEIHTAFFRKLTSLTSEGVWARYDRLVTQSLVWVTGEGLNSGGCLLFGLERSRGGGFSGWMWPAEASRGTRKEKDNQKFFSITLGKHVHTPLSATRSGHTVWCYSKFRRSTPPQAEPLAQYLARRDLISSGLYQFDDKPENYRSWYSSFTSAAREVHLSATQELDLMTKWLGKESGEMVKRIRSVHVSNPNLALQKHGKDYVSAMLHQKSSKGHCFSDWTVFLGFQLKTTPNYVNLGICLWKSKVLKKMVISQVCRTLTLHVESHQL